MADWHARAVSDVRARETLLTDWEKNFLAGCEQRLAMGITLDDYQEKHIVKIHERVTRPRPVHNRRRRK
ncbi:MAG: hypothetical protein MOGMAGMI_02323 [Candidatus Omnitrophica bacterium]|nr:hypothetical protein [Candidatus Omnitrophota bacterium]